MAGLCRGEDGAALGAIGPAEGATKVRGRSGDLGVPNVMYYGVPNGTKQDLAPRIWGLGPQIGGVSGPHSRVWGFHAR